MLVSEIYSLQSMENRSQVSDQIAPLLQVFNNNVRDTEIISITPQRLTALLSHNNVCFEQLSIVIRKQFPWSGLMADILNSLQTYLNNLNRWISQISISPVASRGSIVDVKIANPSGRCEKCHDLSEIIRIRGVKEQLLGTMGVMQLSRSMKTQKEEDDDEFLSKKFWDDVSSVDYERNKHALFSKVDPFLTHWYAQEKCKKQNFEKMSFEIQKSLKEHEKDVNHEGKVDEVIADLLISLRNKIGNVQVMKRVKNLLAVLQTMIGDYSHKINCKDESPEISSKEERRVNKDLKEKPENRKLPVKLRIKEVSTEKRYIYSTKKEGKKDEDEKEDKKHEENSRRDSKTKNAPDQPIISEANKTLINFSESQEIEGDSSFQNDPNINQKNQDGKRKQSFGKKKLTVDWNINKRKSRSKKGTKVTAEYGVQCAIWAENPQLKQKVEKMKSKNHIEIKFDEHQEQRKLKNHIISSKKENDRIYTIPSFISINKSFLKNQYPETEDRGQEGKGNEGKEKNQMIKENREKRSEKKTSIEKIAGQNDTLSFNFEQIKRTRNKKSSIKNLNLHKSSKSGHLSDNKLKRNTQTQSYHRKNETLENQKSLLSLKKEKKSFYQEKILKTEYTNFGSEDLVSFGRSDLQRKIEKLLKSKKEQKQISISNKSISNKNLRHDSPIFQISDLDLFGGMSQSFKWEESKTNISYDRKEGSKNYEFIQRVLRHIQNVRKFKTSLYNQIISFLSHPFSLIEHRKQMVTELSSEQIEGALFHIFHAHEKNCKMKQCCHIAVFLGKICFAE